MLKGIVSFANMSAVPVKTPLTGADTICRTPVAYPPPPLIVAGTHVELADTHAGTWPFEAPDCENCLRLIRPAIASPS